MPRYLQTFMLIAGLACAESTVPSEGDRWDLLVVRHRLYNCDPDAFTFPFPSTPDPAICGSDSGLVSHSRDTLRAQLTLDGLADYNDSPTDTAWTAAVAYEWVTCIRRPAPGGCEIETDSTRGFIDRGHRTCPAQPGPFPDSLCDGRPGEPFITLGAVVLTSDTIAASYAGPAADDVEGTDVAWDPQLYTSRLSDTLAFRLRRVRL